MSHRKTKKKNFNGIIIPLTWSQLVHAGGRLSAPTEGHIARKGHTVRDLLLEEPTARLQPRPAGHHHRDVPVQVEEQPPLGVVEDGRPERAQLAIHLPAVEFVLLAHQQQQYQVDVQGSLCEPHFCGGFFVLCVFLVFGFFRWVSSLGFVTTSFFSLFFATA